ncbi:MAG: glycosyltransferase family 4 protein [Gammaproteobacteria bacterium]|nr:glycosyltransferase family 4 protein [Gammaproteobacteria bacterium]MDH3535425.1 glycosyltransferase family 4 protein [Gammaproteobacteria bacterium]
MRIAITHPTTSARVCRGTERLIDETAAYMSKRDHEVRIIACKPGRREVIRREGYICDSHRRMWHPALGRLGVREEHAFVLTSMSELLRRKYDVVHAHSMGDAAGATLARHFNRTPFVFFINGLPPRARYYRTISTGGAVFSRAVSAADEIICVSEYVRNYIEERFGRRGELIPVPLNLDRFPLWQEPKQDPPIIFCAAALNDHRKGGRVLMRAFNIVKQRRPEVVLQNASAIMPAVRDELIQLVDRRWRDDVQFLGSVDWEDLPRLYGRATVSVLPSLWEAFGLVTVESMATGTPVVGTDDGALPEIIDNPQVGSLFEPGDKSSFEPDNFEALAEALCQGLELGADPATPQRCRAHVEKYGWATNGPLIEQLYRRVANISA